MKTNALERRQKKIWKQCKQFWITDSQLNIFLKKRATWNNCRATTRILLKLTLESYSHKNEKRNTKINNESEKTASCQVNNWFSYLDRAVSTYTYTEEHSLTLQCWELNPGALCMIEKCSASELQPQLQEHSFKAQVTKKVAVLMRLYRFTNYGIKFCLI